MYKVTSHTFGTQNGRNCLRVSCEDEDGNPWDVVFDVTEEDKAFVQHVVEYTAEEAREIYLGRPEDLEDTAIEYARKNVEEVEVRVPTTA